MDKRKTLWLDILVWVLLYTVLMSMAGYFLYERYLHQKENYTHYKLETTAIEFESLKEAYNAIANTTFHISIDTPEVRELMAKAVSGDKRSRERYRRELYAKLSPLYRLLEDNNMRQLHFHLPGSISFLRFHRPEKYGDSLKGIRPSIDAVNATHKSAHGFEEGRIFNGFRHVYPLFYEGKFVGSVELSYSFDSMRELASKLYPAQYHLILKKKVIEKTVFGDEQTNYAQSFISPEYVYDRQLNQNHFSLYSAYVIKQINILLSQNPDLKLGESYTQLIPLEIGGEGYVVVFNPLHSYDHKLVGYSVRYQQEEYYKELWDNYLSALMMAALISGLLAFVLVFFMHRIRKQQNLLQQMADSDKLTGIANRGALERELRHLIGVAERQKTPLSVIFFDIDHFKQINDHYGHQAGDQALIDLTRIIQERLRQSDSIGRWGGEEFIIVLPNTELEEAVVLAEELRMLVEIHPFGHGRMSCSFGLAQLGHKESLDDLINRADWMLYRAKEKGRNRVISAV